MRLTIRATLLAGAIALGCGPAALIPSPALAQMEVSVSFDYFHDQLAPYGAWLYSDRWGMVWQPGDVPDDFTPYYTSGHWVYTDDYGWLWVSDYGWGDVPFHYGRWVNDPDDGWLWIPGYTWGPAWVVWRTNNSYIGWMAMPPDPNFLEGAGISIGFGGGAISFDWNNEPYFGYRQWYGGDYSDQMFARNWVFIDYGHIGDPNYGRYAVRDPARVINIVHQTTTVVNYTVVNNYVVNKGIDPHRVEQIAHHPITVVPARQVIRHPNLVATVDAGRRAGEQARAIAPIGRGVANSAPPPSAQVVQRLSTNAPKAHGGHAPAHLFTKTQASNPTVVNTHFHGKPAAGAAPNNAAGHAPNAGTATGTPPGGPTNESRGRGTENNAPAGGVPNTENRRTRRGEMNGAPPGTENVGHPGGAGNGPPPDNAAHLHHGNGPANGGPSETGPAGGSSNTGTTRMHRGPETGPTDSGPPPGGTDNTHRMHRSGEMNGTAPASDNTGHPGPAGGPPPENSMRMHHQNDMNGAGPPPNTEPGGTRRTNRIEGGPPPAAGGNGGNPPGEARRAHGNPPEETPPPDRGGEHNKGKHEKPEDNGPPPQ